MKSSLRRSVIAIGLVVGLLTLTGLGAVGSVGASSIPTAGSQQWAYGAESNGSASWTNTSGGFTGSLHAFFGWHSILTQTNTSASDFSVEIQRTMALDYHLLLCKPDCANANGESNVSFHALESETGFANLTTVGTVTEGGAAVPATALVNASSRVTGNVTESVDLSAHVLLTTKTSSYYFTVQAESLAAVAFSPALGLVPTTLGTGASWNATSSFVGSGSWSAQLLSLHTPMNGTTERDTNAFAGQVARSGTVAVFGSDSGPYNLDDGATTNAIDLAVYGPFHFREGLILLPGSSDVFGSGDQAWAPYQNDSASAGTSSLNVAAHQPHFGVLAASTAYTPHSAAPSTDGPAAVAPVPVDTNGGSVVQGQPETVAAATQGQQCLVAGNCPSSNGTGALPSHLGGGLVGLLLVAVVVVVVAVVVVERRRQIPPPVYPNAELYPPGVSPPPASPAPPRPGSIRPAAPVVPDDDPLGHLW
jgi:hypothetical protein